MRKLRPADAMANSQLPTTGRACRVVPDGRSPMAQKKLVAHSNDGAGHRSDNRPRRLPVR